MDHDSSAPLEFEFSCPIPSGLHARPASRLSQLANDFACEAVLTNLRNGMRADMHSVLGIIAADVRSGDVCRVRVGGTDDRAAIAALRHFVDHVLPTCDLPLADAKPNGADHILPRALRGSAGEHVTGRPASGGIARGKVVVMSGLALPADFDLSGERGDTESELERLERALGGVRRALREKLTHPLSATEAAILNADLAIATDISLARKLRELLWQGKSAGQAVIEAATLYVERFRESDNDLIRERALDVQEICVQLLEEIYGARFRPNSVALIEPSVVVAETVAPQQLLGLDRRWLKALVLEYAGMTSHAVILARSLGIPTLVGIKNARRSLRTGQEVIVDADRGVLIPQISPPVARFYDREIATLRRRQEVLARLAANPAATSDGRRIEVGANASSLGEVQAAFENGAEGIGLFRTEMLFLARDQAPTENEQFEIYAEVVRKAAGRPVIFRTVDIGGDKPASYLNLPGESNPSLGYRGVRLYREHQELIRTQLRAILRASAVGALRIMAPMVAAVEEVRQFKQELDSAKQELQSAGVVFDLNVPVGIMIEVPAASFVIDRLCAEVDFFSIGTNDLSQYFLAADRENPKIAQVANVRHPGFLRLLKHIVDEAHRGGRWVGMCGEMAGDPQQLPFVIGLCLDEISMPGFQIADCKRRISQLFAADCEQLITRAASCGSAAEVDELVQRGHQLRPLQPLFSTEIVVTESNSKSKEEAIREMVDLFYVAGRTDDRDAMEEAVWARESVYSTGLGYGCAMPHCKSNVVTAESVGILRLKEPIDWGSVDNESVTVMIFLASRESDPDNRHLQVFARLARKMMDENFRREMMALEDAQEIVNYLSTQLEVSGELIRSER